MKRLFSKLTDVSDDKMIGFLYYARTDSGARRPTNLPYSLVQNLPVYSTDIPKVYANILELSPGSA